MSNFTVPEIAGTDIRFRGVRTVRPTATIADTLAIVFTHDWGPLGTEEGGINTAFSMGEWESLYGDGASDGRDAVLGAFVGPGIEGLGGAGGVISYRVATSAAARAELAIDNTDDPAEEGVAFAALYAGTRGNRISLVVEADPADEDNARLRVLFDGATIERYVYPEADLAALATQVNARSKLITATVTNDGFALEATAAAALTGGDNGESITASEVTPALEALEFEPFTAFLVANLESDTIQAAVQSWVEAMDAANRPVMTCFGGADDETFDAGLTRAAGYDNEHILALIGAPMRDEILDKTVSTAVQAARVMGALVARGEASSILFARFAGLKFAGVGGVASDQVAAAEAAGALVFNRSESVDADVLLATGVTSLVTDTDDKPKEIFGDPRLVRICDLFIRRCRAYGNEKLVGGRVTDESRAALRDFGLGEIGRLIQDDLILPMPGTQDAPYFTTPVPDDPSLANALPFEFGWIFAKTTRNLVGVGSVR